VKVRIIEVQNDQSWRIEGQFNTQRHQSVEPKSEVLTFSNLACAKFVSARNVLMSPSTKSTADDLLCLVLSLILERQYADADVAPTMRFSLNALTLLSASKARSTFLDMDLPIPFLLLLFCQFASILTELHCN